MKSLLKYVKNTLLSGFFIWLIGRIVYGYYKLVLLTSHVETIFEYSEIRNLSDKPLFFAFWHSRVFAFLNGKLPTTLPISVLISSHKDGKLIASATHKNIQVIFGSTNRNSNSALRQILRAIKAQTCVAITPDGPRGPTRTINSNIIGIAKLCQTPIVPMSYAASKAKTFNSWDKFVLPKPFGKICIIFGTPIYVLPSDDESAKEKLLKKSLDNITKKAEQLVSGTH